MKYIHVLSLTLLSLLTCWGRVNAQAPDATWVKRIEGNQLEDKPTGIAIDANNNVYLTGYTKRSASQFDYFTLIFRPNGDVAGVDTVNPGGIDQANSISARGANVYVTGTSKPSTHNNITTVRYDTGAVPGSLNRQWSRTFSFGSQNDAGKVVKTGSTGLAFVAGNSKYTSADPDIFVLKYSLDGNTTTSQSFDVSGNKSDFLYDMALDASDNIYTTGTNGSSWFVVKHNSSITKQWTSTPLTGNAPAAIRTDTSGYVYVTGDAATHNVTSLVLKGSDGSNVATLTYNGPGLGLSAGNGLKVVLADRAVYVTGFTPERITGVDWQRLFVAKWTNSGTTWTLQWSSTYGWGTGTTDYEGNMVTVDTDGNVYVIGMQSYKIVSGLTKALVLKYNSSGTLLWSRTLPGDLTKTSNVFTDMQVDNAGGLYISSQANGEILTWNGTASLDNADMDLTKFGLGVTFAPTTTFAAVGPLGEAINPGQYHLDQNYPNPFNPTTTIRFTLPEATSVWVKIYDMLGREVKNLIDAQEYSAGTHTVSFDASGFASGTYFYGIVTSETRLPEKKMLLIK